MMRRLSLAVLLALAAPVLAHADTVYFKKQGSNGIESVSGTVVQETARFVEIVTEDGRTVAIAKGDVFQIIRDAQAEGAPPDPFRATRETPSFTGHSDSDRETSDPSRARHYGIKGGMNISNLSVDPQDLEEGGSLRSFALGAWYGMPLNRRLALQAEALYSVKGDSETASGYTASTQMRYIDVPVLARIGFMHDAGAHPSLYLGPSFAFNLSAKSKLEGDSGNVDEDVKDQVRALDFGVVFGGGVDFAVGKHTYGVELRYSKGLSNAADESANGSAHNNVLAVMGSMSLQ